MTAPDPVRAALEAAASSLRRPWPSFPTRGMTAEQQRQRAHEMAAAATIAAFLRGIADCATQWEAEPGDIPEAWFRDMAAAVEAAAREGA